MKHLRVAVLRGGPSDEYDVSMMTGAEVIAALMRQGIDVVDVVISRRGTWMVHGFERTPKDALVFVDLVFNALHGAYGEDGTLQRELDRFGIPYTGSRAYPSALAINKILAKEVLRSVGIKTPPHLRVTRAGTDVRRVAATIESLFGPVYMIKPVNGGSSIGIRRAHGMHELVHALNEAFKDREEVLVEKYIQGREATVGVIEGLRGQQFYSLPTMEIIPPASRDFFDYEVKYNGETDEICPGGFLRSEKDDLADAALKAHTALGLSHYSRSDFIVNDKGIYFLETNTLPALANGTLFPKALAAVGHDYDDFVRHLLDMAR